jgi:hypothetical protein
VACSGRTGEPPASLAEFALSQDAGQVGHVIQIAFLILRCPRLLPFWFYVVHVLYLFGFTLSTLFTFLFCVVHGLHHFYSTLSTFILFHDLRVFTFSWLTCWPGAGLPCYLHFVAYLVCGNSP